MVTQIKHTSHAFSIFTHMTERERLLLLELSQSLGSNPVVVEIGSYLGASACFLAEGIKQQDGKVYAVDTWTNLAMSEGSRDTYKNFLQNIEPLKYWIIPLKGLSVDIAKKINQQIDLLFIDGDHSYQGIKADLQAWLPKVKENGIVVFHDYSWAEGVRQAVKEDVFPLQVDWGRRLDSIYWTKINYQRQFSQNNTYVTVAIPTYKRSDYLIDALQSAIDQETNFDFELLVLDNDCDRTLEEKVKAIAKETTKPVRYIPVPEIGLHNGRNTGAIEGKGEIIVYIDDDVITPQGWLQALCQPFADSQVACVGGKTIAKWEATPPEWIESIPPDYFSILDLGEDTQEINYPQTPYGCNMAFRRHLVLGFGGFPPDGMGGAKIEWRRGDGETGFAYKIYAENYKIMYAGKGWLYHRIPAQRMTLAYARSRSMKGAISGFYTELRTYQYPTIVLVFKGLKSICKFFYFSFINLALRFFPMRRWLKYDIQAMHYAITALYQLRLAVDRNLRRWVEREDYWQSP